jgi:hypothetical protein
MEPKLKVTRGFFQRPESLYKDREPSFLVNARESRGTIENRRLTSESSGIADIVILLKVVSPLKAVEPPLKVVSPLKVVLPLKVVEPPLKVVSPLKVVLPLKVVEPPLKVVSPLKVVEPPEVGVGETVGEDVGVGVEVGEHGGVGVEVGEDVGDPVIDKFFDTSGQYATPPRLGRSVRMSAHTLPSPMKA